ncbi:MAG: hypothetical protein K2N22_04195 [Clostridia bacterium]|nr:hypothetical protein [Clostridia bacterium]
MAIALSIVAIVRTSGIEEGEGEQGANNVSVPQAYTALQIGLRDVLDYEISDMYIDSGWHPDFRGEFEDEAAAAELRDMISKAVFWEKPAPSTNKNPGDGSFPSIYFTANEKRYGVSLLSDGLGISVSGNISYYYTNCTYQFSNLVHGLLNELFEDYE